jgi:hypothetical protein
VGSKNPFATSCARKSMKNSATTLRYGRRSAPLSIEKLFVLKLSFIAKKKILLFSPSTNVENTTFETV